MRIGTWNLAGRWDARHLALLESMDCDVLLLTEVSSGVRLPGHHLHLGDAAMAPHRRWAAVASRAALRPLPDPHGASAMAEVDGLRVCSSVLPWRTCGSRPPWTGTSTAERTSAAVAAIESAAPTIWGGDWNHALSGREWAGSAAGRGSLLEALGRLGLQVPTAAQPHQLAGLLSIDHVAAPAGWTVTATERHPAFLDGAQLSDHDAYAVEAHVPA